MKRTRFFVMLLGAVALLLFAVHAGRSVVRADVPESIASQIYQPSFDEFVFVYLRASYRDYGDSHYVSVDRQSNNGRVRYKLVGRYEKAPAGQAWFDRVGSKIRKNIDTDCKAWTAYGLAISPADFDIDIAAEANDKAK